MKSQSDQQLKEKLALPPLPERATRIIDDIESGAILGASRSIRLINDVFVMLAEEYQGDSGEQLADDLQQWANYLIRTRGALSPAVGNAIRVVFMGFEKEAQALSLADVQRSVRTRTEIFNRQSIQNIEQIAVCGANLLLDGDCVLAYDYSSSVNAVLRKTNEQGKSLHVIIPESRSLYGGRPILEEAIEWGHQIRFTVDAAMGQALKSCSAVLVGVESLTADGGFWNTVGTCSLSILAKHYNVPVYVPTELLKFDPRSLQGEFRQVDRQGLHHLFPGLEDLLERKDVIAESDDLEFTPPEFITVYITEQGILPPASVSFEAKAILGLGD